MKIRIDSVIKKLICEFSQVPYVKSDTVIPNNKSRVGYNASRHAYYYHLKPLFFCHYLN